MVATKDSKAEAQASAGTGQANVVQTTGQTGAGNVGADPLDTNIDKTLAGAKNDDAVGAGATTQHGAEPGVPSDDTEIARVDGVEITRPNQRLVSPKDHGKHSPHYLATANIPAGSEPTVVDVTTGRPAETQVAKKDEKRLAKLREEAEGREGD